MTLNCGLRQLRTQTALGDLDCLSEWFEKWLLKFNPAKCRTMHVAHIVDTKYIVKDEMNRIEIQTVTEEKYLGIDFTSDLKPSNQCITAAAKARRII